jgi:putative flippase GtrA
MMGAVAGATVNYTLARIFVFDAQRGHAGAIPRFLATAALSAALNGLLMAVFVNLLGIPYIPAQVAVTVILATVNYLASRHWTFRDRRAA